MSVETAEGAQERYDRVLSCSLTGLASFIGERRAGLPFAWLC